MNCAKRLIAAIGAITLLVGGCGDRPHTTASGGTKVAVPNSTTTIATDASSMSGGGTLAAPLQIAKTSTTTTAHAKTPAHAPDADTSQPATETAATVTAKADEACVHPGDVQGLQVTAVPAGKVLYDSVYSDNSDALTKGYATGFGSGDADAKGTFHATWAVPVDAPAGPARVNVMALGKERFEHAEATFTVKPAREPC